MLFLVVVTSLGGCFDESALRALRRDGVAGVRGLVGQPPSPEWAAAAALEAVAEVDDTSGEFRTKRVCRRGAGRVDLKLVAEEARVREVATRIEEVFGGLGELSSVGCVVAYPGAEAQHLHADGNAEGFYNVFVALRDVTRALGPTEFALGTHRDPHAISRAPTLEYEENVRLAAPLLAAGDALVFDYRVLHRGLANTGLVPRPVVYGVLSPPGVVVGGVDDARGDDVAAFENGSEVDRRGINALPEDVLAAQRGAERGVGDDAVDGEDVEECLGDVEARDAPEHDAPLVDRRHRSSRAHARDRRLDEVATHRGPQPAARFVDAAAKSPPLAEVVAGHDYPLHTYPPMQQLLLLLLLLVWSCGAVVMVPSVAEARARGITEKAALEWLGRYEVAVLPSSSTAFVRTRPATKRRGLPLVLVHGFDSNALEFRRLLEALEARSVEAYALDVRGWGFSEGGDASTDAKRTQLREFVEFLNLSEFALAGASLGGAVAIDFALATKPTTRLALVAPQCLVDGTPDVPAVLARLGVRVLKSRPLRAAATRLAYHDKALATSEAIEIGGLHLDRAGWADDQVDWLLGEGYALSGRLQHLEEPPAIFWGRQDQILPPQDSVPRLELIFPTADVTTYDACGHTPHLEKPAALADDLLRLLDDANTLPPPPAAAGAGGKKKKSSTVFDWARAPEFPTAKRTPRPKTDMISVEWNKPVTIAGLLFFVPLFSAELFFAISRQFICPSAVLAIADLCSPV
ncbi:hypothetical protein CTAYLR_008849 [Chrysophaeum taylorii]|uniref:AB hydrolase-1 domain-containing protein n=1 Tax=Chrysophaeum taylorii TaxID=2483200 RepID=A0AAD7UP36_9STRA|nr:hypothetical protein CTAYLR_008849 [Chrysophaeum taylorii]